MWLSKVETQNFRSVTATAQRFGSERCFAQGRPRQCLGEAWEPQDPEPGREKRAGAGAGVALGGAWDLLVLPHPTLPAHLSAAWAQACGFSE